MMKKVKMNNLKDYIILILIMKILQIVCNEKSITFDCFCLYGVFVNIIVDHSLNEERYINIENDEENDEENDLNQQIMELSEKVKSQEISLKQSNLMYEDLLSANEQLQQEKESVFRDYLREKKTNEGQIDQILRLNKEVIQSIEEKQELEKRIVELQNEISELKKDLDDPDIYYKIELGKALDDKQSIEELFRLKDDEMKQLKSILSEKLDSKLLTHDVISSYFEIEE